MSISSITSTKRVVRRWFRVKVGKWNINSFITSNSSTLLLAARRLIAMQKSWPVDLAVSWPKSAVVSSAWWYERVINWNYEIRAHPQWQNSNVPNRTRAWNHEYDFFLGRWAIRCLNFALWLGTGVGRRAGRPISYFNLPTLLNVTKEFYDDFRKFIHHGLIGHFHPFGKIWNSSRFTRNTIVS